MKNACTVTLMVMLILILGCGKASDPSLQETPGTFLVVLGVAQDAGYPQINCKKSCCLAAWKQPHLSRRVTSMGIVDTGQGKHWIIDATPDFKDQWQYLEDHWNTELAGIFLTHAHIGHYTGLMHLGREALGGKGIAVYAMPRMCEFLENNGPWDQLVRLANIELHTLDPEQEVELGYGLTITPRMVPHRDEYSETVGYWIKRKHHSALYIPDIDKWEKWEYNIGEEITKVDLAFIDGSFFEYGELSGRDMTAIPHPLVKESMAKLQTLNPHQRSKVHFIHFNHTNPLLHSGSAAYQQVLEAGYKVAEQSMVHPLQ